MDGWAISRRSLKFHDYDTFFEIEWLCLKISTTAVTDTAMCLPLGQ